MTVRIEWNSGAAQEKAEQVTNKVVFDTLAVLFELSTRKCPLQTGRLQASGQVTMKQSGKASVDESGTVKVDEQPGRGEQPAGAISYDTPYTVKLHEHPEYQFQQGREGKWLENTMNEHGEEIFNKVSEKYRDTF